MLKRLVGDVFDRHKNIEITVKFIQIMSSAHLTKIVGKRQCRKDKSSDKNISLNISLASEISFSTTGDERSITNLTPSRYVSTSIVLYSSVIIDPSPKAFHILNCFLSK